jgi:hypothetical protein
VSRDAFNAEAERQRRLIDGLLAPRADERSLPVRETGARALRGLQAYRVNANASAERALGAAFPTVQMLLGQEDFEHLACEFWRADPPLRGDLAEWGTGFAAWVEAHEQLADWPYLGDCARLDWALHGCERAPDDALDSESLARLGDTDPSRLAVRFMPGLAVIESRWPIAGIHRAHHAQHDQAHASFDELRAAIEQAQGEAVVVSRRGWKAIVTAVDSATAQWMRQLQEGCDLASAIDQAGEGFDFTGWLTNAIQSNWVKEISVLAD